MKIYTTRFGELEVDEKSILKMPRGPLGFEDYTDFVLIQHRPDTNMRWLQSATEPGLAFVVIDPSEFFSNYEIEISDAEADKLKLTSEEDAVVLTIVTISGEAKEVTANLAAPIVVNSKELLAMQVILQDDRYSIKQPLVEKRNTEIKEQSEGKAADKITVKAA